MIVNLPTKSLTMSAGFFMLQKRHFIYDIVSSH